MQRNVAEPRDFIFCFGFERLVWCQRLLRRTSACTVTSSRLMGEHVYWIKIFLVWSSPLSKRKRYRDYGGNVVDARRSQDHLTVHLDGCSR